MPSDDLLLRRVVVGSPGSCFGWLPVWLLSVCLLVFCSTTALAQLYSGSVTGIVTDPMGAVVPGAKVTLTDAGKGYSFNVTTDAAGRYVLRNLAPSTYKLLVESSNFKTYTREGVTLDVNQNATVDVTLELGSTTQTVEVKAAAPLLSTQDAVTGQEVNRTFINDLPLISRSVYNLAFLSPGVTQAAGSSFGLSSQSNNFISNGGRNATADVLLDGVSSTNYEQNSAIQLALYTPSVDAVQEFKLQQNNFSADIGFSGATVVNVVTRSGSNSFHGSLYEFLRNERLNANNWFNNANNVKISPIRLNQFGGTVGGPIRKDKTFFFFDYQGTRNTSSNTKRAGVPSAAERQGNFGELCGFAGGTFDASGKCSAGAGQLWDPYTGVFDPSRGGPVRSGFIPFNNMITYQSPGNPKLNGTPFQLPATPGNLIDPVAFKMMQFYPQPNVAVGTPAYNRFNNWIGTGGSAGAGNQIDIKIDHRFGNRDLLSGKYAWGWNHSENINCFGNVADPCTQGPNSGGPHLFALNHTHSFSPSTVLNLSYGVARSFTFTHGVAADFPDFDPVKTLGLPSYITRSGVIATPAIVIQGGYAQVGGNDSLGSQAWSLLKYGQETHHLAASLNRMLGRHELKFGGEMRVHRINFLQSGVPEGIYTYNFTGTSQLPTSGGGDGLATFLIGAPGVGGGQYEVPVSVSTQNFQYATYFQDNWRVTDKLTLNLGLRYDLDLPRTERYNRMSWVDPNVPSPLQVPGLPNLTGGLVFASDSQRSPYDAETNNFGPRVGFAYRLSNKTVLRGGYGIFYEPTKGGSAGTGAGGFTGFNWNTPWLNTFQSDGATPFGRLSDPFPVTGPQLPPGNSLGLLTAVGLGIGGPIRAWGNSPYMQTWSFGLQHELPGGVLIDGAYVGTKGTHLYFAGAGGLNFLGPQIETFTPDQITALRTFVPNPFFGIITDTASSLRNRTVQALQLLQPHPQYTGFGGADPPWANSIYHAFQLRVEKRFSRGLQFLATYTNSKSIDNSSVSGGNVTWLGGSSSGVQDPNRRYLERSLSQFDISQVLQFSYVYQLPWGRGRRWGGNWNAWLDGLLGGWQTNGIWRFDTGMPIGLGLNGGQSLPTYGGQRANLLAPLQRNTGPNWMDQYFANPGAAVKPPKDAIGTAPRVLPNVRVPGTNTSALSLFKEIPLGRLREGSRLEYRIEAFNALNHPQFNGPSSTVNTGNFGNVTSQANSPRNVQMALKLYW